MGTSSIPWNDWYHCMGHTYGTWLPGDPRGFRTRHHKEHVNGDYKNPPLPGLYETLHALSKSILKRDPIYLSMKQRERAVFHVVESLHRRNIEVRIASVDAVHLHVLARFPDNNPRHWIGVAKKESSHYLKTEGLGFDGGLWAVRTKNLPVADESHFMRTLHYIQKHEAQGAYVWLAYD